MGACLATAALELGHEVIVVSGPVDLDYPSGAKVVGVVSTDDLLKQCEQLFPQCDGLIGAAAPCDYKPIEVADHKIRKTGETLELRLVETEDVVAHLGSIKQSHQWTVGFALETEDARFRALSKLIRKACDLVVLNGVAAIDSAENSIEIISAAGEIVDTAQGAKEDVARAVLKVIHESLIEKKLVEKAD